VKEGLQVLQKTNLGHDPDFGPDIKDERSRVRNGTSDRL